MEKDIEEWEKEVEKMGLKNLGSMTQSGFAVKPVYTPADLEGIDYKDILVSGQYPYTRGYYPVHYQVNPPMMTQQMSYGSARETMERREFLKKLGRRMFVGDEEDTFAMILALDLPTQTGFDADDPESRGKVCECGPSMSTLKALEEIFEGSPPLSKTSTVFISFNAAEICTAMYAVYCTDIRKEPLDSLVIWSASEHHCQYHYDMASYPPVAGLKLKAELVKWLRENCPQSCSYVMDGYNVAEAGAIPSFEVALAFAEAIATIEECIKIGLDPDDFLPSFYSHFHIGLNLFEEVSKFRAMRRLWAKIAKERFGCKNPEALKLKTFVPQCGGYETAAIEPLNNIIRITTMTLAGLLADQDGVHTICYDEPLGVPTDESIKISTRTLQILAEETDILHVTDPLGGSYYVEWLTSKMEEEILKKLNKMEELGGFMKCLESGWIKAEVESQAYERMRRLDKGEDVRVGVNKYRIEDRPPHLKVIRRPPELEDRIIDEVKSYKRERDHEKTRVALNKLKEAATEIENDWPGSAGCLMPALIEAVRAKATLGECSRIFREVFGYGYFVG